MSTTATETVTKLNGMLKGELSALETYRQALDKVEDSNVKQVLMDCHKCHSKRVDSLVEKINKFGGKASDNSGAWGAFVKLLEGGATIFGDKAAVSVLEEGEDKGLADYKKLIADDDPAIRECASCLLEAQEGTHAKMRDLKHSM